MWISRHNQYTIPVSLGREIVIGEDPVLHCKMEFGDVNTIQRKYYTFGEEVLVKDLSVDSPDFCAFVDTLYSGEKGVREALRLMKDIEERGKGEDIKITHVSGIDADFFPLYIERE